MAGLARIAWRNLGRNRRRSLTTGTALAFGICLCVASYGLVDGLNEQLLEALTRYDLGHAQIHNPEFAKRKKLQHTVADSQQIIAKAMAQPGAKAASPRAYAYALISSGTKSTGVELVGVDPEREIKVTTLHEQRVAGRYLDAEPTPWPQGRQLSAAEQRIDEELTRAAEGEAIDEIDALEQLEPPSGDPQPSTGATDPDPAAKTPPSTDPDATPQGTESNESKAADGVVKDIPSARRGPSPSAGPTAAGFHW